MRAREALALPLLAAVLVVGCGASGDDRQAVATKIEQFTKALGRADYQMLCDQVLAPALVEKAEGLGLPCETQLARTISPVKDPFVIVERVKVNGKQATAFVETGAKGQSHAISTITLTKTKAGWRVSSESSGAGSSTPAPSATTPGS